MLLAIDVGNTNTEFGVFEGENLLGSFRMMTKSNATSDEIGLLVCQYFQRFGLDRTRLEAVMVASVVPQVMYTLTAAMVKYLGLKPIVADVDVDSGLRYGPMVTDERLGPDRSCWTSAPPPPWMRWEKMACTRAAVFPPGFG